MDLMTKIPEMAQWKTNAETSTFYGKLIQDMGRDELLGLIGFLYADGEATKKLHAHERDFLASLK